MTRHESAGHSCVIDCLIECTSFVKIYSVFHLRLLVVSCHGPHIVLCPYVCVCLSILCPSFCQMWHLAVNLEGDFTVCMVACLSVSPLGLGGELAWVTNVPLSR